MKQIFLSLLLLLIATCGWAQKVWEKPTSFYGDDPYFDFKVCKVEFLDKETVLHLDVIGPGPGGKIQFAKDTYLKTPDDKQYHIDDAAFTLGGSVLAGYEFTGWKVTSAEADCWTVGDVIGANDEISGKYGNVTVVAQFDPVTSYITYQHPNGSQWQRDSYTIENAIQWQQDENAIQWRTYAKDGYTFNGWTVVSADANCWPSAGTLIEVGASYDALSML